MNLFNFLKFILLIEIDKIIYVSCIYKSYPLWNNWIIYPSRSNVQSINRNNNTKIILNYHEVPSVNTNNLMYTSNNYNSILNKNDDLNQKFGIKNNSEFRNFNESIQIWIIKLKKWLTLLADKYLFGGK